MRARSIIQTAILTALLMLLVLMVGCSDERIPLEPKQKPAVFQIQTTVPRNDQINVPLSSNVVIYFSEKIDPTTVVENITVVDENGNESEVEFAAEENSVVISPAYLWDQRTSYIVTVRNGVRSDTGISLVEEQQFFFTTGIRRPRADETLEVTRVVPTDDGVCWDFMTFRVYFNEPIDRTTVEYDKSFFFVNAETDEHVPGNLFGRGNQIVFDPDEDLTPGVSYWLTVTEDLKDYSGEGMAESFQKKFTAVTTGKHTVLAMDNCPTVVDGNYFCEALPDNSLFPKSKFIDRELNSMFADSVLLGPTKFMIGSRLWNEFGDPKLSPSRVPFVVRKGQQLVGSGLKGYVGGEIPSGVDTGNVTVTVLTDTVGELLGSEFVYGEAGLPATITLTMDAAMATEGATSDAIMAQPILGTTLTGQAVVERIDDIEGYEAMTIELVGFAEFEIVNEYVPVTMALKMVPPPEKPEYTPPDLTPPTVLAVAPVDMVLDTAHPYERETFENDVKTRMAGEEIVVSFSEPVDPDTVRQNIFLQGPGGKVSGRYDLFSPKVAFIPDRPLNPDTTYIVVVKGDIEDISGNKMGETKQFTFKTMPYQSSEDEPPLVNGSAPGIYDKSFLYANFVPEFYFSQIMEESSFEYGKNVMLYDVTAGNKLVSGTLFYHSIMIEFVPDELLISGHEYIWQLADDVTNIDGVPVDTDADRVPGGPPIKVPFVAKDAIAYSQSHFVTYPYVDTNTDGFVDGTEVVATTNYMDPLVDFIQGKSYVMGYFPIIIEQYSPNDQMQPILIQPGAKQYATNLSIGFGGKAPDVGLLDLGRIVIEMVDPSNTDLYADTDGLVGVDVNTNMLFSVENQLINNFLVPETKLQIPSVLRFTRDGRMVVLIDGESSITMDIPIIGQMDTELHVKMTTVTEPSRRGF